MFIAFIPPLLILDMNKDVPPKVSVIIPTYNDENVIHRSIESAINQSYTNIEIIVVDDGSADNTISVIKEYKEEINLLRHKENLGGSAARNSGICEASGDYLAFLDADDEWKREKLETQINYMLNRGFDISYTPVIHKRNESHSRLRKMFSNLLLQDDNQSKGPEGGSELIPKILNMEFDLGGSSTLVVSSDIVYKVGGFDPEFPRHQDWEFLIRLLKESQIGFLDEYLVIKYNTGSPPADKVADAKRLLFEKFSDEIREHTDKGVPIRKTHRFHLAKIYLSEGKFRKSYNYIELSDLCYERIIELTWLSYNGFINYWSRRDSI